MESRHTLREMRGGGYQNSVVRHLFMAHKTVLFEALYQLVDLRRKIDRVLSCHNTIVQYKTTCASKCPELCRIVQYTVL